MVSTRRARPARSTSNHLRDAQQALIDRVALLISWEIFTHYVRQSLRSCQYSASSRRSRSAHDDIIKVGVLQPED